MGVKAYQMRQVENNADVRSLKKKKLGKEMTLGPKNPTFKTLMILEARKWKEEIGKR